ncbi:MAG: YihY family inner membrane protein [Herminiimonas sp.]|uniref:YihY family inner membrane protein n=1 Tax=Herminiimonas sp. TaxID=1926289 RepID=UPI002722458E|nr:YihY family inner membrane protein [Herminiimonas sp.]MDO9419713.1 YihY family inner membrane protein [Herminiimonas sp.]
MKLQQFPLFRDLSWPQMRHLFRFAARRLDEERLPQVAGSLTFTTVLALVPILTIALAIFTTFPLFNTFRASLEAYFVRNLMPQGIANTILGYLTQFSSKATRLSAVGAVALIVTAVMMMLMIDRVFNQIWRVKTTRPITQRILVYWAIVTLGPLLIGASITLTSYVFTATNGVVRNSIPFSGGVLYSTISILLTTVAFTLLYIVVPNRLVEWRDALCGGLLAAIAFEVVKRLFAVFVVQVPTYTVVYGAVAAFPIFLVWIYLGWLITLGGAVVTAALPIVKYERWWHVPQPGSAFVDAMALLAVLYEARTNANSAVVDTKLLRDKTRLGFDESEALLEKMLDANWVGHIKTEGPKRMQWGKRITDGLDRWVLLANPQQLTLADVYRVFVFDVASDSQLAQHVEAAVEQGLNVSLAEHFSHQALQVQVDQNEI